MFQAIDKEWEAFLSSQSSTNDARMLPILYQSTTVSNLPKLSSVATDNNIDEFEDEISLESAQQEPFDDSVFDVEIDKNKIPEIISWHVVDICCATVPDFDLFCYFFTFYGRTH